MAPRATPSTPTKNAGTAWYDHQQHRLLQSGARFERATKVALVSAAGGGRAGGDGPPPLRRRRLGHRDGGGARPRAVRLAGGLRRDGARI